MTRNPRIHGSSSVPSAQANVRANSLCTLSILILLILLLLNPIKTGPKSQETIRHSTATMKLFSKLHPRQDRTGHNPQTYILLSFRIPYMALHPIVPFSVNIISTTLGLDVLL
jgi:hypothetical protein